MLSWGAQVLQRVLERHGAELPDPALEEVVTRWGHPEEEGQPLAALQAALRERGVTLPPGSAAGVAWALLGVERPHSVRLGPGGGARLTHLAECLDVALPSTARSLARQFRREAALAPDLLRPRPGLVEVDTPPERALEAVFETEWSGFLALLGEFGPWVYVPSVADLQALSRRYAALVERWAGSRDPELLAAALGLGREWGAPPLLARLEVSDHRGPRRGEASVRADPAVTAHLIEAEAAFWRAAGQLAAGRRAEWATRRGR